MPPLMVIAQLQLSTQVAPTRSALPDAPVVAHRASRRERLRNAAARSLRRAAGRPVVPSERTGCTMSGCPA